MSGHGVDLRVEKKDGWGFFYQSFLEIEVQTAADFLIHGFASIFKEFVQTGVVYVGDVAWLCRVPEMILIGVFGYGLGSNED